MEISSQSAPHATNPGTEAGTASQPIPEKNTDLPAKSTDTTKEGDEPGPPKNDQSGTALTGEKTGKRFHSEATSSQGKQGKKARHTFVQRPITKAEQKKREKIVAEDATDGAVLIRHAHNLQRIHSRFVIHIGSKRYADSIASLKEKSDGSLHMELPLIGHMFYTEQRKMGKARKKMSDCLASKPETLSDKISSHVITTAFHSYSIVYDLAMSTSRSIVSAEVAKRRARKSKDATPSNIEVVQLLQKSTEMRYACTIMPDIIKYASCILSETNMTYFSMLLGKNPILHSLHRFKCLNFEGRAQGNISPIYVRSLDFWRKQCDPSKDKEFRTPSELRAIQSTALFTDCLQKVYKKEVRDLADKCRSFVFQNLIFPIMMCKRLSIPGWTVEGNAVQPPEGCENQEIDANELMTKFFVENYKVPLTEEIKFKNEKNFVVPLANDQVINDWRMAAGMIDEKTNRNNMEIFKNMVQELYMFEHNLHFQKYVVEGERSVSKLLKVNRETRTVKSAAKINLLKIALEMCTMISGSSSTACYLASHKESLGAVLSLAIALNGIVKELSGEKRSLIEKYNGGVVDAFYLTMQEKSDGSGDKTEWTPVRPGYVAGVVGSRKKLPFYEKDLNENESWSFLQDMGNYFIPEMLTGIAKRFLIPRNIIYSDIALAEVEELYGPMFEVDVSPTNEESSQQPSIDEEFPADL